MNARRPQCMLIIIHIVHEQEQHLIYNNLLQSYLDGTGAVVLAVTDGWIWRRGSLTLMLV
jgi:hypothetical protein